MCVPIGSVIASNNCQVFTGAVLMLPRIAFGGASVANARLVLAIVAARSSGAEDSDSDGVRANGARNVDRSRKFGCSAN